VAGFRWPIDHAAVLRREVAVRGAAREPMLLDARMSQPVTVPV